MKTEVKTERLNVGYGKSVIIENVEFSVKSGEIVTLIGSNGSGKSTVLKSIAKQLEPVSGAVYIDSKDIKNIPVNDFAKRLSIMTTERLHTELMTCREVIESGRYPYTGKLGILSDKDKEKVELAMKLVRVNELQEIDFNKISDGQRQRVMLARAVCQEADILVLDEPTSFLDIRYKLELLSLLKKLAKENGTAVIMSLHELDLAEKISDRIICIKDSKIDRYGKPNEIFSGGYINELYGIEYGTFNDLYGCTELSAERGVAEIFVIGGGGNGIPIYRSLARQGISFATGVIHENDMDFPVASVLAEKVITQTAFEPIEKESIEKAIELIKKCSKVINCVKKFGTMNNGNLELYKFAEKSGKLILD